MKISVVVPSYRRVRDLQRCFAALIAQRRLADEIIVTVRNEDRETYAFARGAARDLETLKIVVVKQPGVICAMNAALTVATGEIVAMTDDDAAPWPDWLERIEEHFEADDRLGGVGGRDWQYRDGKLDDGNQPRPGELSYLGRLSAGHHHAAPGPAREVDVVKGVNLALRTAALRPIGFDTRLLGSGAQVHWETGICLALKRKGWKIVFDPALSVDHFPARRFDEDQRSKFSSFAHSNAVANETLVVLEYFHGIRRLTYLFWVGLVGTSAYPGLVQLLRLLVAGKPNAFARWRATVRGRATGLRMLFLYYRHESIVAHKRHHPSPPIFKRSQNDEQ